MLRVLRTILDKPITADTTKVLEHIIGRYRKLPSLLTIEEYEAFNYMLKFKEGNYPSGNQLCSAVEGLKDELKEAKPYAAVTEIHARTIETLNGRERLLLAEKFAKAAVELQKGEMLEATENDLLKSLQKNKGQYRETYKYEHISAKERYEERGKRKDGIKIGIHDVEQITGDLTKGTINIFAAFVGGYKSMVALNIAYHNTYTHGFNGVVLSLEVSKEDMWWNLLSLHSGHSKFGKKPVEHNAIRYNKMTAEEREFIFDVVEPDLKEATAGKLFLIDEADFSDELGCVGGFTQPNVQKIMEDLNQEALLDFLVVDHINLTRYYPPEGMERKSEQDITNNWISFFRQQCKGFRVYMEDGESKKQELCTILLMQTNREGFKKASRNDCGVYDITALNEASEAEKSAYRIFFLYNSPALKEENCAKITCAKNRSGAVIAEPVIFTVVPNFYQVEPLKLGGGDDFVGGLDNGSSLGIDDILGL